MTIPALPALDRTSPTFRTDVDTFFATQLPAFAAALDPEIERLNALGYGSYNTTSATSLTIGTGSKSLTIETGKGYVAGQAVLIASTAAPTNFMTGQVTSYNSGTGALVVSVSSAAGSGTVAAWTISVTALAGGGGSAVGDIITAESAPSGGWLPCDGSIYLQSAYPSLFAKLGTRWQNYYGPTTSGPASPKAPRAVKWLNGQFVVVSDTTSDTTQFYTTSDGAAWTGRTAPQLNQWRDVEYGSGYYVAISSGTGANRVARSTDGVTWTSATAAPDANSWYSIAHGGGVFVAVSLDGTNRVTRSTNAGANWSGVSVPARSWIKVIWTGTRFVAFASGHSMTSTDGVTWVETVVTGIGGSSIEPLSMVWTGKEFLTKTSAGPLSLAVSPDGINFSYLQSGPPLNLVTGFSKILYANKTLFVSTTVSTGGIKLFITHDLQNWASSWERDSSNAFSGELAMSDGGLFISTNSSVTWYRACGYNTATQFVVPAIGPKAFIKAE